MDGIYSVSNLVKRDQSLTHDDLVRGSTLREIPLHGSIGGHTSASAAVQVSCANTSAIDVRIA